MVQKIFLCLCLVASCVLAPLYAGPATFGGEIEFTNDEIDKAQYDFGGDTWRFSDESAEMQDRFYEEVWAVCKGCKIRVIWDHDGVFTYRVRYPDGWYFHISLDPHVIEIQTAPATVKKLKSIEKRIQTDIFDVAKKLGLKAGVKDSGGHLHMGLASAFGDDAQLFRNFVVDFINHSELANGILVNDHSNAPPLQALSAEQRSAFEEVIRDFDEGRRKSIWDIAEGLISRVYYESTEAAWAPAEKFHALNVVRIFEIFLFNKADRTVEIRCIRGQKNARELILEAELFESRLEYLKKLKKPLAISWGPAMRNTQSLLDAFYRYVTEAGLKWSDYKNLLPQKFQKVIPSDKKEKAKTETAKTETKSHTSSRVKRAPALTRPEGRFYARASRSSCLRAMSGKVAPK